MKSTSDPLALVSRKLPCHPGALWGYLRGRISPARLMINAAAAELMPLLSGEIIELGATARANHRRFAPANPYVLTNISGEPGVRHLDAMAMDLPDNSVDGFVAISVLEHIPAPWLAAAEIHRALKPGGRVLLIVPFLFPFHSAPGDFYRYSEQGLARLFAGFRILRAEALGNFFSTVALFLQRPLQWSARHPGSLPAGSVHARRSVARGLAMVTRLPGLAFYLFSRCVRRPDDYACLFCVVLEKHAGDRA